MPYTFCDKALREHLDRQGQTPVCPDFSEDCAAEGECLEEAKQHLNEVVAYWSTAFACFI